MQKTMVAVSDKPYPLWIRFFLSYRKFLSYTTKGLRQDAHAFVKEYVVKAAQNIAK